MFRNSKGELVPHCEDCIFGDVGKKCPDNALTDEVDNEKGVINCPGYAPFGVGGITKSIYDGTGA